MCTLASLGLMSVALTGCSTWGAAGGGGGEQATTRGVAQTGSESGWRAANTQSMKEAFSAKNGFKLIFNAADNKPENQIAAVHSFINQGVDAIVIAAVVTTG